jgi:hypothetical protein
LVTTLGLDKLWFKFHAHLLRIIVVTAQSLGREQKVGGQLAGIKLPKLQTS